MSETIVKRLYIGGLSSGVTENEIAERFSRFGKVSDLSLKSRQDDEGVCVKVFAHLNIEGNEENIKKCFNTYQNTKWKGSVLKLQYAKESFLTKLEKEREAEVDMAKEGLPERKDTSVGEWKCPEFTKLNGPAVPGTPIPGKKDWVVGKYGRVLPILNVKKSYKLKAVKHDPSKFCHAARIFKDENTDNSPTTATCDNLTWEISKPDSEITKKRKGEFPPSPSSKKSKNSTVIKPKDYFTSDSFKLRGQGNERNIEDFEVVKIGLKKNSVESTPAPSRFDSDIEDFDTDSGKINMPQNSVNSSRSKKKVLQSPKKKTQSSQTKNELLANAKLIKLSENDEKHSSPDAMGDISKNTKLTKTTTNQRAFPTLKSNDPDSEKRKVPEFAGLGMLSGMTSHNTLQSQENNKTDGEITSHDKTTEKRQKPRALEKTKSSARSKEKVKNDNTPSSKRSLSIIGTQTCKEGNEPCDQASKSDCAKNNLDLSKPKKLIKKMRIEGTSPPSGKNNSGTKSSTGNTQVSVLREDDGNDTTSSADTDEIIAQCKMKQKTDSEKKDGLGLKDSLLNESMDLSEFSASAPEVLSNSFGNYSQAFSSITPDSYDSDLDSNDFELVAKKLAFKAASQSSQMYSSKEKTLVTETLSEPGGNLTLKVKKNEFNTPGKKSTDVKVKDLSPSDKTLQSKLLAIANTHTPQEKLTRSEKPCKKRKNKHVADNEKRLQALDEQKKVKEQQKQIVKAALENVENACTKRIVFSSSDEEDGDEGNQQPPKPLQEASVIGTKSKKDSEKSSPKLTLLDSSSSDESDYEEMFKSKPQFEGKKGEKLMELQRKIGDSRFQMDEKFMDSEDSDDEEWGKDKRETKEQNSLKDEKKMNLEVLENVVGKSKMDLFTAKLKKKTKHIIDMNAVRFDPTKIKPKHPAESEQKEEETSGAEEEEMEVEPASSQPVTKSTKSEEKTKKEKRKKNSQEPSKSSVTMSSSLVDMLKSQGKEEDRELTDDTSFSLLQQFDENKESSDEEDIANCDTTPLSHLLSPKGTEKSEKISEDENVNCSSEDSEEDNVHSSNEESDEEDNAQNLDEDSNAEDNAQKLDEDSDEEDNVQSSDEEDNVQSSDKDSDEEDNAQISDEEDNAQISDEEDNAQMLDEDSDEEDNAQISDEENNAQISDEENNAQSSDEENNAQSSHEEDDAQISDEEDDAHSSDEEGDTEMSKADSEMEANNEKKKETAEPNKRMHYTIGDLAKEILEDADDDVNGKDELKGITTPYNPLAEKENALISAGRADIRFAKKDWLERWDEIRTDLMKLCRRKHKDAGKRKRVLNEEKRKKDILKNVKRKPWLKR